VQKNKLFGAKTFKKMRLQLDVYSGNGKAFCTFPPVSLSSNEELIMFIEREYEKFYPTEESISIKSCQYFNLESGIMFELPNNWDELADKLGQRNVMEVICGKTPSLFIQVEKSSGRNQYDIVSPLPGSVRKKTIETSTISSVASSLIFPSEPVPLEDDEKIVIVEQDDESVFDKALEEHEKQQENIKKPEDSPQKDKQTEEHEEEDIFSIHDSDEEEEVPPVVNQKETKAVPPPNSPLMDYIEESPEEPTNPKTPTKSLTNTRQDSMDISATQEDTTHRDILLTQAVSMEEDEAILNDSALDEIAQLVSSNQKASSQKSSQTTSSQPPSQDLSSSQSHTPKTPIKIKSLARKTKTPHPSSSQHSSEYDSDTKAKSTSKIKKQKKVYNNLTPHQRDKLITAIARKKLDTLKRKE